MAGWWVGGTDGDGGEKVSSARLGKARGGICSSRWVEGGAAATCTGRHPILSGSGCIWGFVGALRMMAASGRSENVGKGQGGGARQNGEGATGLI